MLALNIFYSVSSTLTVSLPESLVYLLNLVFILTSQLKQIQGLLASAFCVSATSDSGEHNALSPNDLCTLSGSQTSA